MISNIQVGDYFLIDDDEAEIFGIMKVGAVTILTVVFESFMSNIKHCKVDPEVVMQSGFYRKLKFDD